MKIAFKFNYIRVIELYRISLTKTIKEVYYSSTERKKLLGVRTGSIR